MTKTLPKNVQDEIERLKCHFENAELSENKADMNSTYFIAVGYLNCLEDLEVIDEEQAGELLKDFIR